MPFVVNAAKTDGTTKKMNTSNTPQILTELVTTTPNDA